jgi:nitrate reductase assembly molybdenum cofactor insertion protein NarJ
MMWTQGGAAATARRRHGLEVEDEELPKHLVVIFVFLGVLCIVRCFF